MIDNYWVLILVLSTILNFVLFFCLIILAREYDKLRGKNVNT